MKTRNFVASPRTQKGDDLSLDGPISVFETSAENPEWIEGKLVAIEETAKRAMIATIELDGQTIEAALPWGYYLKMKPGFHLTLEPVTATLAPEE